MSGAPPYDALLLVSFGGPEGMADVMPFLDQVLRGRNVPPERQREVARHYERFGGVSPINAQNRALLEALRAELASPRPAPPPLLGQPELASVPGGHPPRDGGGRRATSARPRHVRVQLVLGVPPVPGGHRSRPGGGGADGAGRRQASRLPRPPGFVEANADRVRAALATLPPARRAAARIAFTAHSIPAAMASGCDYVAPAPRDVRPGRGGRAARALGARLPEPERSAASAMARAGHPRPPRDPEGRGGPGRRRGAGRVRVRPHGDGLRPGHRGP